MDLRGRPGDRLDQAGPDPGERARGGRGRAGHQRPSTIAQVAALAGLRTLREVQGAVGGHAGRAGFRRRGDRRSWVPTRGRSRLRPAAAPTPPPGAASPHPPGAPAGASPRHPAHADHWCPRRGAGRRLGVGGGGGGRRWRTGAWSRAPSSPARRPPTRWSSSAAWATPPLPGLPGAPHRRPGCGSSRLSGSFCGLGGALRHVRTRGEPSAGDPERPGVGRGLPGLAKTMAREWSGVQATALDVAREGVDPGEVAAASPPRWPPRASWRWESTGRAAAGPPARAGGGAAPGRWRCPLSAGDVVCGVRGRTRGHGAVHPEPGPPASHAAWLVLGRNGAWRRKPPGARGSTTSSPLRRGPWWSGPGRRGSPPTRWPSRWRRPWIRAVRELRENLARFRCGGRRGLVTSRWTYADPDASGRPAAAGATELGAGPGGGPCPAGVVADKLLLDKTPPAQLVGGLPV